MSKHAFALLILALFTPLMTGCGWMCPPTRLNVTVELEESFRKELTRDLQVDLVVINSAVHPVWKDASMNEYWAPGSKMRNSVPTYPVILNAANPSKTLDAKNSIWDMWWNKWGIAGDSGVPRLYVLALLPGVTDDKPGDADPRRKILPLLSCRWDGSSIKIIVQKTSITPTPAPKTKPTD